MAKDTTQSIRVYSPVWSSIGAENTFTTDNIIRTNFTNWMNGGHSFVYDYDFCVSRRLFTFKQERVYLYSPKFHSSQIFRWTFSSWFHNIFKDCHFVNRRQVVLHNHITNTKHFTYICFVSSSFCSYNNIYIKLHSS